MTDGGDYDETTKATPERIVASLLVVTWVVAAYFLRGLPLAVRACIFYMIPLAMIWLPDLMARFASLGSRKDPAPPFPVSPIAIRAVAWFLILGIPAAWAAFYWAATAS